MSKRTPALLAFATTLFLTLTPALWGQGPTLTPQNSNTTPLLIAVSPVDENVVWAVGTNSVFVVTTDGGNTWRTGVVPTENAGDIQFRDVQGVSDQSRLRALHRQYPPRFPHLQDDRRWRDLDAAIPE